MLAHYGAIGWAFLAYIVGPLLAAVFLVLENRLRRKELSGDRPPEIGGCRILVFSLAGLWGGFGLGFLVSVLSHMMLFDYFLHAEIQLAVVCGILFLLMFVGGTTWRYTNAGTRVVHSNIGRGVSVAALIAISLTIADYAMRVHDISALLLNIMLGVSMTLVVGTALTSCVREASTWNKSTD